MDKIEIKSKYDDELKLRNYSKETVKSYTTVVKNFFNFADNITIEDVKRYILQSIDKFNKAIYESL